jgi:hypothetical protein
VLVDRVAQVFYILDPEIGKHVVVSRKQKIVWVQNMENNDEDINQFEEMPLFTNPMNIKNIEKYFDKNIMSYMRKGGNEKFVWKFCITFHINVAIYLYGIEFVSYFLATKFVSHMPYIDLAFCSSCHVVDRSYWKQNWNKIKNKNHIKFKCNSNKIENKIHQTKLKSKFKWNWKWNSWNEIKNKIQTKLKTKFIKQNSNENETKIQTKFIKQNSNQSSNEIENKI